MQPKLNIPKNLLDKYEFHFTGLKQYPNSIKLIGQWIAHPKINYIIFSAQVTVIDYLEESEVVQQESINFALETMIEMLIAGEKLASKYHIKGIIPVNSFGEICKQQLSQIRRVHTKLGIWPN